MGSFGRKETSGGKSGSKQRGTKVHGELWQEGDLWWEEREQTERDEGRWGRCTHARTRTHAERKRERGKGREKLDEKEERSTECERIFFELLLLPLPHTPCTTTDLVHPSTHTLPLMLAFFF